MSKKGSNFFEEHIDKIVLGIVGAVCLWLMITRVALSPNFVEYDNKKFSPGGIDNFIDKQAEVLENKVNQAPESAVEYKPRIDDFIAKFDLAMSNIDANLSLPQPSLAYMQMVGNRTYTMPDVGEMKGIEAEHIRAVAYVPTQIISEENIYSKTNSEPNDIDLVTVEAKFDVAGLYERFFTNFAGDNVREEQWKDQRLAIPIFAAVQLQRQELLRDGLWSDWKVVSRTQVDYRKKTFDIAEDVRKLPPGGARVLQLQLNDAMLLKDLLQPEGYKIASLDEEWFPPSFHKEFLRWRQILKAKEKHDTKAAAKDEREASRTGARQERRKGTDLRIRTAPSTGEEDTGGGISVATAADSAKRAVKKSRPAEKEGSEKGKEGTGDVYSRFSAVLLNEKTDLAHMSEPLTFWAIDDTVQTGNTYRYRIRLGVFNPVAGTGQFSKEDEHLKNSVILWSNFSDVTKTVEVPATLYFFPRDIQEAVQTVVVQVSKYVLGNWYSKDFMVKRGEVIGKTARSEPAEGTSSELIPAMINYDTGAVLVDIVPVNDWAGGKNLHSRNYFNMLCSSDGSSLEHMPIQTKNWSDKLVAKLNEIKKAEKDPKLSLREWGSRVVMTTTTTTTTTATPGKGQTEEFVDY